MVTVKVTRSLTLMSIEIMVKVTRSLTLMSIERVSLVEYACQISSLFSFGSKVMAKVKVFLPQSHRQTESPRDRQDKN